MKYLTVKEFAERQGRSKQLINRDITAGKYDGKGIVLCPCGHSFLMPEKLLKFKPEDRRVRSKSDPRG